MFDSAALDHGFGIEVTGLDLAGDVGSGTMAKLKQLFHERQLMVIRGQDIAPERFLWQCQRKSP